MAELSSEGLPLQILSFGNSRQLAVLVIFLFPVLVSGISTAEDGALDVGGSKAGIACGFAGLLFGVAEDEGMDAVDAKVGRLVLR
jgi:hypothetical protein